MSPKELIKRTKQLVAIPSTADNPAALKQAVDFLAEMATACPGVTVERFERNGRPSFLAYRGSVRPEKFQIILNAHVDVVPAPAGQFQATEKDGKLYGRGVLDMKGTAVVLADVFCELVNEVPYALGLQVVSDEEVGGYDGVKLHLDSGVRADFVIMGEYANEPNTIYNAARGLCWTEIAFSGKASHGAHLWHGTNAVLKASEFAAAVLKRYPTPDKETWTTTASIASITTPNDTFNKVPDRAVLKIDFRFTQEDPVFQNRETVEKFVKSVDPNAQLQHIAVFEPAVHVEELNPYVQGLSAALQQATGQPTHFVGRPGGSDGRHYAMVNVDIVEFGLRGGGSHSDQEYVEIDSFAEYQTVLRSFLRKPLPDAIHQADSPAEPLPHRLLARLVSMPSVSDDFHANHRGITYIEHFLASRGMHVATFEHEGCHSLVATTQPGSKQPAVMLNAHLDVVPGAAELFELRQASGRFTGRGVLDMKFAIASYLALVDKLQHELDRYDFGIMITCDEEVGGNNGARWLVEELGYRSRVAIVPDGGENWELETFCKGVQWIQVTATGKSGHASRPWEGESAIHRLLAALQEIKALVPADHKPEDTFLSIGTIEGGTTANQIPTAASAMIDARTGSLADHRRLFPRIQEICKRHSVQATLLAEAQPCANDPENPYIKSFLATLQAVTGITPGSCFSFGATDGRFFNAAGVPCVIIQPHGGDRHKDSEWLSVEGFDHFCQVVEAYIRQVGQASSAGVTANTTHSDVLMV